MSDWGRRKVETVISMRRCRKVQTPINGAVYALRNLIERCFSKLNQTRRLATRSDNTTESYLASMLMNLHGCDSGTLATQPRRTQSHRR